MDDCLRLATSSRYELVLSWTASGRRKTELPPHHCSNGVSILWFSIPWQGPYSLARFEQILTTPASRSFRSWWCSNLFCSCSKDAGRTTGVSGEVDDLAGRGSGNKKARIGHEFLTPFIYLEESEIINARMPCALDVVSLVCSWVKMQLYRSLHCQVRTICAFVVTAILGHILSV